MKDIKEHFFNECITFNEKIRSIDVNIELKRELYIYEYSIDKFREIVKNNNLKKQNFLQNLNNLDEIKNSETTYEKIHETDNEMIIYRLGKYYAFHIKFNGEEVDVKGIIRDYDVLNRYTERNDNNKRVEDIIIQHMGDPVLSSYSPNNAVDFSGATTYNANNREEERELINYGGIEI
tara:strand:- start:80 stop:613 length:534 start_codon:yes stop_codon:yes gene_type:complete